MGTRGHRLRALAKEEAKLQSLLQSLRQDERNIPASRSIGTLSSYDQHPADEGSETYEREKDLGLLRDTQQQITQVQRARKKLRQGTYGLCDNCKRPIGNERQKALPHATLCVDCKADQEENYGLYHRPAEETMVTARFTRPLSYPDNTAYDAEDTWQDLARYATTDSSDDDAHLHIDDLWQELHTNFPGDPEKELAAEITPDIQAIWQREFEDEHPDKKGLKPDTGK